MMTATTPPEARTDAWHALRALGVPDQTIARAAGCTRQEVHRRCGPRPAPPPAPRAPDLSTDALPGLLLAWRTARGLTQAEASAIAHVGQTAWSAWEQGRPCKLEGPLRLALKYIDIKLK